jgi:hypothetical protein
MLIAMLVIVAIAMRESSSNRSQPSAGTASPGGASHIVALPDRSTLHVPEGTVGRDIVDWLASGEAATSKFELGGDQFVGRTAEPTPELSARATRLVKLLKAYPDVKATVVGHTDASSDAEADKALSLARAQRLVQLLKSGGIRADRLQAEGHGSSEPLADNHTAAGQDRNQRVSLMLRR